ncbi:hypothetical protein CBW65_01930 [Tumebacillus avium]|uniref:Endonuclease GajA/Old nuclease/RecF-like AAA domain-containing protein n=1 Tax=Tumebacillus avium TaxID=1903704 RepID=A0A1Y0IKB1_9BACL|nr:AAA family ATPase [Tumebacillus avium]ARU59955.1 hypothetical protein CBW65_01930 [Tumebacillus avium]
MLQHWTLNIEGFGKIEKASIEVSPLMIFAGDNNSGKSYVMTLLWGLLNIDHDFFPQEIPTTDTYKSLSKWLCSRTDQNEFILDEVGIKLVTDFFNETLHLQKDDLVRRIFNAEIPISKVYLSFYGSNAPIRVLQKKSLRSKPFRVESNNFIVEVPWILNADKDHVSRYILIQSLCFALILNRASLWYSGAFYLPASRTGFMLTYKALAKRALRQGFQTMGPDDQMGKLTAPVTSFLSELVDLDLDPQNPFYEIASFLEKEILEGKIEKDQSPVPYYFFSPDHIEGQLSLHVTSSLVAELAPIVLFLKSDNKIQTLIIEEPEAHLHLDMQRQMARAIVRLVNAGLPVWITTHSDTMLQQFNNLIKLNNHSQQEELAKQYNYDEVDFLDPAKGKVYQFDVVDRKTLIRSQPLTESGFAIPTFTNSIRKLAKETIDLMENSDDEEDDE